MPSDKKRINLTVPDSVYTRILAYKEKQGIPNDASACLQLIVQQLKSQEESAAMLEFIRASSAEQLLAISKDGMESLKELLDQNPALGR